jgi:hypothetical protein
MDLKALVQTLFKRRKRSRGSKIPMRKQGTDRKYPKTTTAKLRHYPPPGFEPSKTRKQSREKKEASPIWTESGIGKSFGKKKEAP